MPIKTFRASIDNNTSHTLRLSTNNGLTGYKINKFQVMNEAPSSQDYEQVYKVYTTDTNENVGTPTNTVDLSDQQLIAVAFDNGQGGTPGRFFTGIIHEDMIVNQDLYVTMLAASGGGTTVGNYYIELEQVKLDLNEATVATLKDMRGS